MKLTFGFSRARSWWAIGSKLIAMSEKRDYSHVYIRMGDIIWQASHGRVHQLPASEFNKEAITVKTYTIDINDAEFKRFRTLMDEVTGRPYSRKQIAILTIMKLFGIKRYYRIDGKGSFICSELACDVLALRRGMIVPKERDLVTPSDFEEILKNNNINENSAP